MFRRRLLLGVLLSFAACSRSLELPNPPAPPGPGSIQGSVVFAKPGQSTLVAAKGATIEILGTSLTTTSLESGYFTLSPIPVSSGALLLRFDADGDGSIDHQKLIRLEEVHAGPGKDVALGQVTLGGNAIVQGTVLRADQLSSPTGNGGTSILVPEGPFLTYSGDNGAFTFENLPEGNLTLSFFRPGYITQQATVQLRPGEVFTLSTTLLTPDVSAPTKTKVSGVVTLFGSASSAGVTVHAGSSQTATTVEDGTYTFEALDPGVYVFGFEKTGFNTVSLHSVTVSGSTTQVPQVLLVPGTSTPPNLDAGQPYVPDAGSMVDAGLPTDSGVPDAGTPTDAGGAVDSGAPDAGVVDAGGLVDSGLPDAGVVDAGGVDAGVTDAGVPDAGPQAVVDPTPAFAQVNTSFTLNGVHSLGVRPFVYHWAQTAGTAVTIANNDTLLAATPSIQAPATPTVLKFTLKITDANGVTSPASPEVTIPVAAPPKAIIGDAGVNLVYASQQIVLDGRPSTDPTGIIEYRWSVAPTGIGITTTALGDGGAQLQVTMPATVSTAVAVTASLDVVNGLGVQSTSPATATFQLTTAAAPSWSVDAGVSSVAPAGDARVDLTGVATAPGIPGATFTYLWSPSREPDSGVADWQLTDATSPNTSFIAPHVVGAPRPIYLTLTATSTSGLTPPTKAATVWVNVIDRAAPNVVSTSIVGGRGPAQGMVIDFDEPIDPAAVSSVTVAAAVGSPSPAPTITNRYVNDKRLTLQYQAGAVDGSAQVLIIANVRDLAPGQPNTMPTQQLNFILTTQWSPAYESVSTSATDPHPGITAITDGGTPRVLVFGRNGNQPWFLAPVDPTSCSTPPCLVPDDTTAPSATLTSAPVRGPRGSVLNGQTYATMQVKDFVGDAGVAYVNNGTGWALIDPPPGTVFSDGTALHSVYAENNALKIVKLDPTTKLWSYADAGIITTDATNFPTDTASDPLPIGISTSTNDTVVVAKTSKTGQLRAFINNPKNSTTWAAMGSLGFNGVDPVIEGRSAISPFYPNSAYTSVRQASGRLYMVIYGDVNNAYEFFSTGVSGFDVLYHASAMWLVAAVNGQILIRYIPYGTVTAYAYPGPGAGGSLNNDTSCVADSPELTFSQEKVFVAWAEHCGANPWKMYFRSLY